MNKKIIIVIAFIIPFALFYIYALIDYYDVYIDVEKLDYIPSNYINMTSQQLNDFSHLKSALIQGEGSIKSPRDEWEKLHDFFDDYDEWIVKYQNNYYRIGFTCA